MAQETPPCWPEVTLERELLRQIGQPGFHALEGAEFHAFIHPCDEPGNSFKAALDLGHGIIATEPKITEEFDLPFPNPNDGTFQVVKAATAKLASVVGEDLMGRAIKVVAIEQEDSILFSLPTGSAPGTYLINYRLSDGAEHSLKISIRP